jgi:outer membrane protein assembly factor BamB
LEHSALGANAHKDVTVLDDEDHVFAGSSGHLYCLDAKTGEILWKNDLKGLGFQNISISINGSAIEILTKIEPM